jgi:hypothetical protein
MEPPLVAISRVVVDIECAKVERNVARHVCAVDDGSDPRLACPAAQFGDRERERCC